MVNIMNKNHPCGACRHPQCSDCHAGQVTKAREIASGIFDLIESADGEFVVADITEFLATALHAAEIRQAQMSVGWLMSMAMQPRDDMRENEERCYTFCAANILRLAGLPSDKGYLQEMWRQHNSRSLSPEQVVEQKGRG
ncbi:hypothetical protein AMC83_CH01935 [Rhizobium phaseoli]|uniref:hypothetical protein n=1 Tax=Rhizobium phaseoli TaxID=396 RepID=UPI0007EB9DBF|nr:hypothetical protein [Rhizobium phaseoli]ANL71918.1 hypothetical protein AMC83_CH01935 [Rhizobium phaseoli]